MDLTRGCWRRTPLNPDEPDHPVFECRLLGTRSGRTRRRVIAKTYADAAMGARTFALMQALAPRVAALPAGVLAVPRALSYDAALRMLVQERAAGTGYAELLQGKRFLHHLRLAGVALAELQRLPACPLPAKTLDEHMAELMRPHPLRLAQLWPQARSRVQELMSALARNAGATAPTVAWLHRDFHVKQLIRGAGRVWVIDWDLAASGDPALDVGNFLLNLEKHLGPRAAEGRLAFLDGYRQQGDAAALARAPLYEAFNCLRRACKAFREQRPGWRRNVMEKIGAAEQRLHAL